MKPRTLAEPLFTYVCRVNRSARKGAEPEMAHVRAELTSHLERIQHEAEADPDLKQQFDPEGKGRLLLVLAFFVDNFVYESALSYANRWPALARELYNELAGDERFFDLLNETLADPGEPAADRLEVYYTCMGLGFAGLYTGQHEYLRKKMLEISARLRKRGMTDDGGRLCPDAYEQLDTSDLIETPGTSLMGIGIVFAGLVVVLFGASVYLYRVASGDLAQALSIVAGGG
ncbi:MAG: DotU family type IV/VI secretion system protein [Phycisphaeraceae bacterium]